MVAGLLAILVLLGGILLVLLTVKSEQQARRHRLRRRSMEDRSLANDRQRKKNQTTGDSIAESRAVPPNFKVPGKEQLAGLAFSQRDHEGSNSKQYESDDVGFSQVFGFNADQDIGEFNLSDNSDILDMKALGVQDLYIIKETSPELSFICEYSVSASSDGKIKRVAAFTKPLNSAKLQAEFPKILTYLVRTHGMPTMHATGIIKNLESIKLDDPINAALWKSADKTRMVLSVNCLIARNIVAKGRNLDNRYLPKLGKYKSGLLPLIRMTRRTRKVALRYLTLLGYRRYFTVIYCFLSSEHSYNT